jgi:uncharacterized protein (DUF2062 family)
LARTTGDPPPRPTDTLVPDATVAAPGFLRRRLLAPLLVVLNQGATPKRLALSAAVGVAVGLFPIFGTTTVMCVGVSLLLRLNQAASQLANHLMYPVQIPLILVFIRLGERLVGAPPVPFSPARLAAEFQEGPLLFLERFGETALHGVLGWAVVAPLVVGAVYLVLYPILKAMAARRTRPTTAS